MAKKSGPARATRLPADQKGRAQLKTIGCQKDRGKAEIAKLKMWFLIRKLGWDK